MPTRSLAHLAIPMHFGRAAQAAAIDAGFPEVLFEVHTHPQYSLGGQFSGVCLWAATSKSADMQGGHLLPLIARYLPQPSRAWSSRQAERSVGPSHGWRMS